MAKKRILGVIGLGHVGAHVAYALAVQGIADELILIDKNAQKLASEMQDLRDAAAYLPHRVSFQAGEFSDLGECDVIVNCVGKIELLRESHDRTTEMDFTIPAVRGFAEKIKKSGFNGVVINITNPCDIVTHELALGLGLPKGARIRHRHRTGHRASSQRAGPADWHRPQVDHVLHARRTRK